MITCKRCSLEAEPHKDNAHLCDTCVKLEDNRVAHYRQHNYNWMEVATEAELNFWERQPGETDHEYNVWLHYRDAYPGKRPTFKDVATELNTTVGAVRKIGTRWSFSARLQAWAKYVDDITLNQRRQEILDMNKRHIKLATEVNEKIARAVEKIEPALLSPREIVSLMKLATELERKARLDVVPAGARQFGDDNLELKKDVVKTENLSEIVEILAKTGVLQNFGVRQTVTTEVVVKGED